NAVLNPGTILGKNSIIYPLCSVRGCIPANSILKNSGEIVERI
ncbi:MAG TPA: UDP-N-acetylglucosamine pyrophosphorylase, partial [Fusibacter sp.]|nr:UDP-N-acetylglucosamine pyrophosphorylase [Fusibacter sp.]